MSKKRIFVLENETMAEPLKKRLGIIVDKNLAEYFVYSGGGIDFKTGIDFRRKISPKYDIYFIHNSLTCPATIQTLLDQPGERIIALRETTRADNFSGNKVYFYDGCNIDSILRQGGVLRKR